MQNLLWPWANRRELARGFCFPGWGPAALRFSAHLTRCWLSRGTPLVATGLAGGWASPILLDTAPRSLGWAPGSWAAAGIWGWRDPSRTSPTAWTLTSVGCSPRQRIAPPHHVAMLHHSAAWQDTPGGLGIWPAGPCRISPSGCLAPSSRGRFRRGCATSGCPPRVRSRRFAAARRFFFSEPLTVTLPSTVRLPSTSRLPVMVVPPGIVSLPSMTWASVEVNRVGMGQVGMGISGPRPPSCQRCC